MWKRRRKLSQKSLLPSLLLSNVRSDVNKMDELMLQLEENGRISDCYAIIVSELWLHPGMPDHAVELTGHILQLHDRNQLSQKQRGGSLCILNYIKWANNTKTVDSRCSPDLKYLTVKCRPFSATARFHQLF